MPHFLASSVVPFPDDLMTKWQSIVDILARISGFTAALIMRVAPPSIEVFVSSNTENNPYAHGHKEPLNSGLFCETVMASKLPLSVPDALADPEWDKNPDTKLGMNCYFGVPILWPDGVPFGTICVLDRERRSLSSDARQLIDHFRALIEANLKQLVASAEQQHARIEAQAEAEDRYAAIFQHAASGIARVGTDGKWLEVNNAMCAMLGYTREELLQRTFQDLTHPDDLDDDLNYVRRMLDGSITRYSMEKRYLHRDGSVVWAFLTVGLVRDRDDTPRYFISIVDDISDKKVLQRALEQSQKLEAIGRLVGGVAHEFNNQLAAISGNLFLARSNRHKAEQYVRSAEELCFSASELVNNLLTYAKKGSADKSETRVDAFLAESMLHFRALLPENIALRVKTPDTPLVIKANATQLQQIVLNLLNNARDAIQNVADPEIFVELDTVAADAEFQLRNGHVATDRLARLIVGDNGIGIPDNHLDKIFDPFFTTKPVDRGTGLGLALVASLVSQHNGAVEVDSSVGRGTRFSIYFPLIDPALISDMTALPNGKSADPPAKLRILVVDDNVGVLKVTREVLDSLGHTTFGAQTGQSALDLYIAMGDIDCVLADVVMPGMNGIELWQKLADVDKNAKVIFVTGYDMQEQVRPLAANCPVIFKPFEVTELNNALKKILRADPPQV